MKVFVQTEASKVEVRDKSHAMKLIATTCYAHQLSKDEIKSNSSIKDLASKFNIDTTQIATQDNPIKEECEQGYPKIYFFGHSDN